MTQVSQSRFLITIVHKASGFVMRTGDSILMKNVIILPSRIACSRRVNHEVHKHHNEAIWKCDLSILFLDLMMSHAAKLKLPKFKIACTFLWKRWKTNEYLHYLIHPHHNHPCAHAQSVVPPPPPKKKNTHSFSLTHTITHIVVIKIFHPEDELSEVHWL